MKTNKCPHCAYTAPFLRNLSQHLRIAHALSTQSTALAVMQSVVGVTGLSELLDKYESGELCVDTLYKQHGLPKSSLVTYLKEKGVWRNAKSERKTQGYKKRHSEGCLRSLGVDNPSKLKRVQDKKMDTFRKNYGVSCQMLRPTVMEKARQAQARTAKATWEKVKTTLKNKYGVDNPGCLPEVRKAHSVRMRSLFQRMDEAQRSEATLSARKALHAGSNWTSKVERRVADVLLPLFPNMLRNVFIGNYNYDIQIEDLLIEVNGDYWHANPAKGYLATDIGANGWTCARIWRKDNNKREQAVSLGYTVLVLWEMDLATRSDESIIQEVKTALQRREMKNAGSTDNQD